MRRCVVVFGPGRSGTSVTMSLLRDIGLRLSSRLVPESRDNPEGHFEDVRIAACQQRLMTSIGFYPLLPRPADWTSNAAYNPSKRELEAIVDEETRDDPAPWGFKDPRTCVLWPLWQSVFRELSIAPRVVFCVRRCSSVVSSLVKAYGLPQDAAEGIVLYRTYHALCDIDQPIFFASYDRWHVDPERQLETLAVHCGLSYASGDISSAVRENVRPSLNREGDRELRLSGALVELDELMAGVEGSDYDVRLIDAWCRRQTRRMDDLRFVFRGLERLRREGRDSGGAGSRIARLKAALRRRLPISDPRRP